MPIISRQDDQARAIAEYAPDALRDMARMMLVEMDLSDPGRPRLAADFEAEVDLVVAQANGTSWRYALAHAGLVLFDLEPTDAGEHPAVHLAEAMLDLPAPAESDPSVRSPGGPSGARDPVG